MKRIIIWLFFPCLFLHALLAKEGISFSPQEKAYLAAHPIIKVHNEKDWAPFNFYQNNQAQGFSIDYMNLLARKTGLNVQYISGHTWDEFLRMMKEKKLDVMLNIVKTGERDRYMEFTTPYRKYALTIFSRKNEPYKTLEALKGKRLAVPKGFAEEELVEKYYPEIRLVFTENKKEALKKVSFHQAEATTGLLPVMLHFLDKNHITNVIPAGEIKPGEMGIDEIALRLGVAKDNKLLRSILDKAMKNLEYHEIRRIERKWLGSGQEASLSEEVQRIPLGRPEQEWLKMHPKIRVHNELDWPPYNYNEQGVPKGYSIDFMRLLGKKLGIEFEFISGPSWDEFLGMIRDKEIDVLHNVTLTENRKAFMYFTDSYFIGLSGIAIQKNSPKYRSLKELEGKKVATVKGFFYEEVIKKDYPGIQLVLKENQLACLQATAFGEVDAAIGNFGVYTHLIDLHGLNNLHVPTKISQEGYDDVFQIGVRKDWPELRDIFQKALRHVSREEKVALGNKWFGKEYGLQPERAPSISITEEEKAYLQSHPILRVSNEMDWPPFDYMIGEKPAGYSIGLMELVARRLGVRFEYINGLKWPDLLNAFKTKQIDIMSTINYVESRTAFARFSKPYFQNRLGVFTRDDVRVDSLEDLRGKKVAIPASYAVLEALQKDVLGLKHYVVNDMVEALEAVASGKADFTMESAAMLQHWVSETGIPGVRLALFPSLPSYHQNNIGLRAAVHKDNRVLFGLLEKALDSITTEEKNTLKRQWIIAEGSGDILRNTGKTMVNLSPESRSFLENHGPLRMCVDPDWMPYERLHNGKYEGMGSDFMHLIEQRINHPVELVPTKSWSESLAFVKTRECDLLPLAKETPARKYYMNFTEPYVHFPFVIVTGEKERFIDNFDMIRNKKLGAVKGYASVEVLRMKYPGVNITETNNLAEGLELLRKGEIYAFVDSSATVSYAIQKLGTGDLKISGVLDEVFDLSIAVRNDLPLLLEIMQQAVSSINLKERQTIYNKWIAIEQVNAFDYELMWKIMIGVLVIFILFVVWNRRLAKLNQLLQDEIEKRKLIEEQLYESEEKFRNMFENHGVVMLLVDPESLKIIAVNHAAKEFYGYSDEEFLRLHIFDLNQMRASDAKEIADRFLKKGLKSLQLKHRLADGSIREVEAYSTPIAYLGKEIMFSIIYDVTEKIRLQDEVMLEREKLLENEKMASLGNLVAGVAHEINTPLGIAVTAVSGTNNSVRKVYESYQAETLDEETFEVEMERIREGNEIALGNLKRAAQLVASFKNVAVDQSSGDFRHINLKKYLEELIRSLGPELKKGSHSVRIHCAENIEINTFPGMLSQIFTNLIMNSVIHGFSGRKEGCIEIYITHIGKQLTLNYKDDGCGISPENLPKILDPFFTTNRTTGSGLGMYIIYNLVVNKLDGQLELVDTHGNGINILINIPVEN